MSRKFDNLRRATARILDSDGYPCGAGFLVTNDEDSCIVLTCAHVVNDALQRKEEDQSFPEEQIKLDFPGINSKSPLTATVHLWIPVDSEETGEDIAGLLLSKESISGIIISPITLIQPREYFDHNARLWGLPKGKDEGIWVKSKLRSTVEKGWIQMDTLPDERTIEGGFSGTPVWDEDCQGAIGMVVAADRRRSGSITSAYIIPTSLLQQRLQQRRFNLSYEHWTGLPRFVNELTKILRNDIAKEIGKEIVDAVSEDIVDAIISKKFYELKAIEFDKAEEIELFHSQTDQDQNQNRQLFTPIDFLIRNCNNGKRCFYFHAPGGFGKTTFVKLMSIEAANNDIVPFYLNLGGQETNSAKIDLNSIDFSNPDEAFKALFRFTKQGGYENYKEVIREKRKIIIFLDSLNEISTSNKGNIKNILEVIDHIVKSTTDVYICVTDRMRLKQGYYPERTLYATIYPINIQEKADLSSSLMPRVWNLIERDWEARNKKYLDLLSVPLFLNMQIRLSKRIKEESFIEEKLNSRAKLLGIYFIVNTKLSINNENETELSEILNLNDNNEINFSENRNLKYLSEVAFEAYKRFGNPIIEESWWQKSLSQKGISEIETKLRDSGIIVYQNGFLYFRHQLLHDFLASLYLYNLDTEQWVDNFDFATLNAKSFDILELASEMLHSRADNFIIEVYDWNYTAASKCILNLESDRTGQDSPVSPELKYTIFTMVTEKKFDPFQYTRERDTLNVHQFNSPYRIQYKDISESDELIEQVKNNYFPKSDKKFEDWKKLFTRKEEITFEDMALLQETPLIAWTAANVFRRLEKSNSTIAKNNDLNLYLERLYHSLINSQEKNHRSRAARWRIVHTLGTVHRHETIEFLKNVINNRKEYRWVRYGAVRSIVELSGSSQCNRQKAKEIFQFFVEHMEEWMYEDEERVISKVFEGLRNASTLISPSHDWWKSEYRAILEEGKRLTNENSVENQKWITALEKLNASCV